VLASVHDDAERRGRRPIEIEGYPRFLPVKALKRPTTYFALVVVPRGEAPMSARSNPFEELERLFERMSRQFEDATRPWESESPLSGWRTGSESEPMSVDLVDRDGEFVATVDLPGFDRENVDVSVTDHRLRIAAERETVHDEDEERFLRHERRHATAHRSMRLPEAIDTGGVTATMRNGVLTVTLPKREATESTTVEIE
jgi:HSP20 family protein